MGEAATTCIAATRKDRRGRMWTNEPAVVHGSSFVEEDEGRSLNSFVPVSTYEGTAEQKIHSLPVGWRNFFPVVLLCQLLVLAGNRFWFYILMCLEYNTVVVLC